MRGVGEKGYVYVARASRSGLVKIGYSTNPALRLRSLCSAVGEPVELVAAAQGDRAQERALLERVAQHSISVKGNREWHRPHPDLDGIIAEFPAEALTSVLVGPSRPRKNAPRRSREVVAAENARLAIEKAERRAALHGHGPERIESCAACRKETAQMAAFRNRRARKGDLESNTARAAVKAHCAQAPALTGGA